MSTKAICVKVTVEEYERMQADAVKYGKTIPELLRLGWVYLRGAQQISEVSVSNGG